MRSKPYRNDRIISVIRDMYFRGGRASFVSLYDYLFENTEDPEATTYEVPIPMVALVATAVRVLRLCVFSLANLSWVLAVRHALRVAFW